MKTTLPIFPHAGQSFLVSYGDDLSAINTYAPDGKILRYEITEGPFKGAKAEVEFQWVVVGDDKFLISWQEADNSTVIHYDDFSVGQSNAFFTTPQLAFYRMQGSLSKLVD